jgi:hypothetical protein
MDALLLLSGIMVLTSLGIAGYAGFLLGRLFSPF